MKNKALITFSLASLLIACKQNVNDTSPQGQKASAENIESVITPIEGLEVPIKTYKVQAENDTVLSTLYGGTVELQANSLVDENGKAVKGEVEIQWQEFHTLTDIMLSGIPMTYDSAGVEYNFVSGGMFTIKALQNGKNLGLSPDKPATVNLGSISDTPCFNFYELNEKSGDWSYLTTEVGEKSSESKSDENNTEKKISKGTLLEGTLNSSEFPELNSMRIIGWKTIDKLTNTHMKLLSSPKASRTLEKEENLYVLTLELENESEKLVVWPYTMDEAKKESVGNKVKVEEDLLYYYAFQDAILESTYARSMQISGFGTYNWDICNRRTQNLSLNAKFSFPTDVEKLKQSKMHLFLISPEESAIINIKNSFSSIVSIEPSLKSCIVAISPDKKVYLFNKKKMDALKGNRNGSSCSIAFDDTGLVVNEANDLTPFMSSLF